MSIHCRVILMNWCANRQYKWSWG